MDSCCSIWWLLHQHEENESRIFPATRALSKAGGRKRATHQMSDHQHQHAQQRGRQPDEEQYKVPRQHGGWKDGCHTEEEALQQSQKQPHIWFQKNSECTYGCKYWLGWNKAALHCGSYLYACFFVILVFVGGCLVTTPAEASSTLALPVDARLWIDPQALSSDQEPIIEEAENSEFEQRAGGKKRYKLPSPLSRSVLDRAPDRTNDSVAGATSELYEFSWHGSRIFALGDLHGDLLNCLLLLCAAGLVDPLTHSWRGRDALLVQTGDINDRGPHGVAVLDFLAKLSVEARAAGGAVLQLLGNHDVMNICGDFRYANAAETAQLGGILGRKAAFHITQGRYGRLLASFLVAAKVDGVVFSHAGVLSHFAELGLPSLTHRLRGELANECEFAKAAALSGAAGAQRGLPAAVSGTDGPLWTRSFTMGPIAKICEEVGKALVVLRAEKMVVGHTVQESGHIETYCNGQLIAIDTGISRYVSNQPKMLEIHRGHFYEWDVSPPRPGESAAAVLASASRRATKRPLGIPPLSKSAVFPQETQTTPVSPGETMEASEDVVLKGDEL